MSLTRKQIMAMEPGREMDVHVGKLVLNVAPEIKWWVVNEEETVIFGDCNYKSEAEERLDELAAMHEDHGIKIVRKELFRNYSGSLPAVWEVLEHFKIRGYLFSIKNQVGGNYEFSLTDWGGTCSFYQFACESITEAICKVALLSCKPRDEA
ncbi:hypothetical protein ACIFQM_01075 [Paenibacillus sp. NRS-1782]|uniref:hypothetical protein n=1 Tax=unclassified Paenibacillus TaxID=185978 RepID=UPI003D2AE9B0